MKGQELCDAHIAAIRHASGDRCADKSEVYHDKGWYYVKVAQKAHDGSWGTWGVASPRRAQDIIARIRMLRGRVSYETRRSRLAHAREVELAHHISVERVWREVSDSYEVRMSVPSSLIKGIQDMRDFGDTVDEAIRVAEGMEGE